MIQKTYRIIAISFLLVLWSFSPANAGEQQSRLDITLSDTTYYICQSIWLDVELSNISVDTLSIKKFHFPGGDVLNITVIGERGDTLKPVYRREFLLGADILLTPEDIHYECFDLAEIFHNYETKPTSPINVFMSSLSPGKYEVSAEYHFGQQKISAPKIPFQVAEPSVTEAEALNLYQQAYAAQIAKDYQLSREKLNSMISIFPKSVYAERAYWNLKKDDELLKKCPDSGYTCNALRITVAQMSHEDKMEFLQKVIEDHPETRSAKFAQQLLRDLNRKGDGYE